MLHAFVCVLHQAETFDRVEPALVLVIGKGTKQRALICSDCKAKLPDLVVIRHHKVEEYPDEPELSIPEIVPETPEISG